MAKQRRTIGTGITARVVESYSGDDMPAAFDAFAARWNAALAEGGGQFGAAILEAERTCRSILDAAGGGPFEPDSVEHYARRIMRAIEATRGHIAANDADSAARAALDVDRLITEASIKAVWERHALRGQKTADALQRANGKANRRRVADGAARHAKWQQAADVIWREHPTLSARAVAAIIHKRDGGKIDVGTIRKAIRKTENSWHRPLSDANGDVLTFRGNSPTAKGSAVDVNRFLTRPEAAAYLTERGFIISKTTLTKMASVGGGPIYRRFGIRTLYSPEDLDAWAVSKLSPPRVSTSDAA